ncbi:MAG TPA: hypothetical protein VNR70_06485 [Steroidobacteraceae bacterium]|nr:hypothetical protein [Steroidobacteraceae bacterium]
MIDRSQAIVDQDTPKNTELGEVIVEFGRHLDMLAEQLATSLMEADRDCVSVGQSFHELAAAKTTIDGIRCAEPEHSVLRNSCRQIGDSLHAAVVALQYHDRLAQRLGLVRAGLDRLQTMLHDQSARSYDEWLHSLRDVERINRIEQQRLDPAAAHRQPDGSAPLALSHSSVELF